MKRVYLPLAIAIGAYVLTTGIGAAIFPSSFGQEQIIAYVGGEPRLHTLGSLTYWALLLVFPIVLPPAAVLGSRIINGLVASDASRVPVWLPLAVALVMIAYCLSRLSMFGGLSSITAPWDQGLCYETKILRRAALQNVLGTLYFSFAFASLPMLGCYLLARGTMERSPPALLSCAILSIFIVGLDLATMQKAPAFIYLLMVTLTLTLSGFGTFRSAALVLPTAVALFASLSITQYCKAEYVIPAPSTRVDNNTPNAAPQPAQEAPPTAADRFTTLKVIALRQVRSTLLRMAVGFPFYVDTFSDPEQRCGIDPSWLRRVFGEQHCFPPTKVFPKVFPDVTFTTGYQPAPVNVSAYAEAGPWYSLLATIAAGALLGLLAGLGRGKDPAAVAITVAACVFAYYVTQSSLTGAFFDSYGLSWLALPLVVLWLSSLLRGAFAR
ncbi:hypothetical protein ABIB96_001285 [Bradyrhizobium sp. LA3.X]|uniref:hypothetical protein n=1 Tax=unclassified Bradyrhizobium TaxID=2631580 RepID=UPI0033988F6A